MTAGPEPKPNAHGSASPMEVFRSAAEFLDAADRQQQWLKEQGKDLTLVQLMPTYFLYGQGIELTRKAFLRTRGFSNQRLRSRPYGHNVLGLYRERKKHGLCDSVDGTSMAGILAAYYSNADWHITFRYVSNFRKEFPTFEAVGVFARVLLEATRPVCEGMEPLDAAMLIMQELCKSAEDHCLDSF